MLRWTLSLLPLLGVVQPASAHFVFVVPEPGAAKAYVVLSESLEPDEDVNISIIGAGKLVTTDREGQDTPVVLGAPVDHSYTIQTPGSGLRIVHGEVDLGITQRGQARPFLLIYHPKTILGDAFDAKALVGKSAPVEIVPSGKAGAVSFRVVAAEKAVEGIEVNVILPDGTTQKVKTDKEGLTTLFKQQGRYGVWARYVEATAGARGDKKYEEIRHYPTLVADCGSSTGAADAAAPATYAPMPEAASSFGAVAAGGWLYIYGGHIVKTHNYSTEAVSGRFNRLNLADGKTWEALPGGPAIQGMNLATYKGKIYRVGGMLPRNKPGEKADIISLAQCTVYDPATRKWESLPDMPEGRSSHDIAVVGNTLLVIGGWSMNGNKGTKWLDSTLTLDLSDGKAQWKKVKQPFERRALIVAPHNGKVYSFGGFTEESDPSLKVQIYDPKNDRWNDGPDLPGPNRNGFAPAACSLNGSLYVSVADGTLYRLSESGAVWDKVAATTPRIVHRLAANGSQILVIGGAAKGDNLNLIEVVTIPAAQTAASKIEAGQH